MAEVANSRNELIGTPLSTATPVPPWKHKTNDRAKELWSLLRCSVKLTTNLVKKADIQPTTVSHGVHYSRKISHEDVITDVIYNKITQEIITIDQQFVRVFYKDGRRKDIIDCGEQLTKIILCSHSNQYAALTSSDEIKLLNFDFELISTAKSQSNVICMVYNESTSEVITTGPGNVTTWCFRYGNKYMIPHKEIKQGLTRLDEFDKLTLECTQSHSQRCYAVCGTSVAVFNLHKGFLQTYKKDLHVRNITSILFFNPLKNIVTGSRDGSIKLWDENFGIRLVFVGHHGPISSLKLYPQGPYIMSSSHDCSIRVWSMETCDEVDLIKLDEPVLGIGTTPGETSLFSYSNYTVDLWTLTHAHQIFTTVGNSVFSMKSTFYPKMADRVMSLSEDGVIRLLSPVNGTVLTTLLPPKLGPIIANDEESDEGERKIQKNSQVLLDAVYCLPQELLFAVYADGSMVKANTLSNPANIKDTWTFEKGCEINCLCLYEYVLDITKLKKSWLNKKAGIVKRKRKTKNPKYGNKTLLLVGRRDGFIANIDIETGEIIYKTEAHGAKGVIGIIANVRNDQVVTAGQDNVVKIWKMFPNTWESLSLMMSFYCAHTPRHMSISGTKLSVAFQQFASATYTVVMYDLYTKERSDHSPNQDHTDELCGLACCHRLKLFASASVDGTVKIWNYDNELVRIIKLNDIPKSITFCNEKGDILIGLGNNIHHIDHTSYLPKMYIFKMVCMDFPEPIKEDQFPLNKLLTSDMKKEDLRKIMIAKSSFMRMDYTWDPMSLKEQEMMSSEERGRVGEYALLSARDIELERIRDGALRPKRANRRATKRTESIAFKKYMALFWDRPKKLTIPDEDDFDPDPAPEREPTPMTWEPERKIGFFPPIDAAKPVKDMLEDGLEKEKHLNESGPEYGTKQKYIINPCGFIPNSILIKLLWPQDEVKKLAEDAWKPPTLSEEQLQMIQSMESMNKGSSRTGQPIVSQGIVPSVQDTDEDEDKIYMMDSDTSSFVEELQYDEEEKGKAVDPSAGAAKKVSKPKTTAKKKPDKKPSALMMKLQGAMKTPTPPPKTPTPPPTPPPVIAPKVIKPTKPTKPIVKFVSRPPPPKDPTPPPPTPLPPTPPPPTPPPSFLTQFEELPWFTRQKDYIFQRMKKPYTAPQFFKVICDVLGISIDWEHRRGIVDALLLLWQQEDIKDARHAVSALGFIFNSSVPPSAKEQDQASYLRSAIKLNQTMAGNSEEFIIELLTEILEGDVHHRSFIRNILIEQGLKDPHLYLAKELDSWETWNLDESRPLKQQIKEMVRRWYDDWNMRFKNHLEHTMTQLQKGDVSAKIRRSGQSKTSQGQRAQITVQASDASLKNVTIMEVINYFCEMMLEEELERVRKANIKPEPTKNTVLVLPKLKGKQAIVRLGEMHTALRVRQRAELAAEYRLNPLQRPYPDLMAAFTNKLSLPTSQIHMNPFPSEIDRFDDMSNVYQPVLLTLKSPAQKYFIPEKSYVHMA